MGKGDLRPHKPLAATRPAVTHRPATQTPAVVGPARIAKSSIPPLTSRTTTLDDPLTTSLLAEIARRPSTVEISPERIEQIEQIDEQKAIEPGDPDPDDPP